MELHQNCSINIGARGMIVSSFFFFFFTMTVTLSVKFWIANLSKILPH